MIHTSTADFANDTHLGGRVNFLAGVERFQRLGELSEAWQTPFNFEKYAVMHIGHANRREIFLSQHLGTPTFGERRGSAQYQQ